MDVLILLPVEGAELGVGEGVRLGGGREGGRVFVLLWAVEGLTGTDTAGRGNTKMDGGKKLKQQTIQVQRILSKQATL